MQEAVNRLVNYQYHLPLAQFWGDGTLSSSDGQRFPVAVQTRNARALPKYFGYELWS
ncbi:Tn3 family transposase [Candidatus Chlorohelix sp.]|uniref:Tn3 family transposase n=1 Tax=Candidatus Chlorohelix sp. TaxID=3139201 RepID=UPI00306C739F